MSVHFSPGSTEIRRSELTDTPELSERLTMKQRVYSVLKQGPLTARVIADSIETDVNNVYQVFKRDNGRYFATLPDGTYALLVSGNQ